MYLTPLLSVAFRRKLTSVYQPLNSMNSSWPMHWVSCLLIGSPDQTPIPHLWPTLMPIPVWYLSLHPFVSLEFLSENIISYTWRLFLNPEGFLDE